MLTIRTSRLDPFSTRIWDLEKGSYLICPICKTTRGVDRLERYGEVTKNVVFARRHSLPRGKHAVANMLSSPHADPWFMADNLQLCCSRDCLDLYNLGYRDA